MTENERLSKLEKRVGGVVKDIVKLYAMLSDKKSEPREEPVRQKIQYATIIEYMRMYEIDLPTITQAVILSKYAAAISLEQGYEIRKADDERFGVVNSYHVDVLDQVFQL